MSRFLLVSGAFGIFGGAFKADQYGVPSNPDWLLCKADFGPFMIMLVEIVAVGSLSTLSLSLIFSL